MPEGDITARATAGVLAEAGRRSSTHHHPPPISEASLDGAEQQSRAAQRAPVKQFRGARATSA
jgi:hypothetical protein